MTIVLLSGWNGGLRRGRVMLDRPDKARDGRPPTATTTVPVLTLSAAAEEEKGLFLL